MAELNDIIKLIARVSGVPPERIGADTDLESDLGITGDDFFELMRCYQNQFDVNLDSYLWYFHHREEAAPFFKSKFPPPNELVTRIPITPLMLLNSANSHIWQIDYPEHTLPKYRYGMVLGYVLIFIPVAVALYFLN